MSKEPTMFNNEYKNKFRTLYLEGKTIKDINIILEFNQNTFDNYYYLNTQGLRDWFQNVKKEFFISKAEDFSRKLMSLDETDDARIYALKQKETEFLRETLGKDIYSKKTEVEGQQPVTININSLKDRLPEPIDTQPNQLDNNVAQYTFPDNALKGTTTPLIENDVKQLTDTVKPDVI